MIALYALAGIVGLLVVANIVVGLLIPRKPAAGGGMLPVEGGELHYLENVAEGLPIVFVHGMPGTCREFDRVRKLCADRHTIAIDRPCYAWSKGRPLDFAGQSDALKQGLATLGVERAIFVGHSFGGLLTLGTAIRHKELVAGMLLIAPAAGGTRLGEQRVSHAKWIRRLERQVVRQIADLLFLRIVRRVASRQGAMIAYGTDHDMSTQRTIAESVLSRHNSIDALANDRIIFNDAERLVSKGIKRVSAPALVLHGSEDATVPLRNGQRVADSLRCGLIEVTGGDHQLPTKRPDEVVAALQQLLSSAQQ
jgi:pimeloyl-ACP methyl ester carboxylesterase